MNLSRCTSLLPALIVAIGVAGASGAQNGNQPSTPIFRLNAGEGLAGGGTGREVSIGIAQDGVTTTHIADGTVKLEDLSASAVNALQPAPQVQHLGESGDIPLGGNRNLPSLRYTLSLDRPRVVQLYGQATYVDQTRPSIVSTAILVGSERVAVAPGVADHGVLHQFNTRRTLVLPAGDHTIQLSTFGQFASTRLFGGGRDDLTFLNITVF